MSQLLPNRIEMGAVALGVGDLDRSADYYRRTIGLQLLDRDAGHAVLGVPGRPLLEVVSRPGGERDERAADLFHFALLVSSRAALGRQLQHFIDTDTQLTGASEHFVSEALYLRDPDGHGIEVYRDRPRAQWYAEDGRFLLGTAQMDVQGVLEAGGTAPGPWEGIDPGTVMGHVHLETTDLALSRSFYVGTLGFDVTQDMAQASFLSVGGYHHHLAVNTWGRRTRPADRSPRAIALLHYEIRLPEAALERLADGLGRDAPREGMLEIDDPTGIRIRFNAAA